MRVVKRSRLKKKPMQRKRVRYHLDCTKQPNHTPLDITRSRLNKLVMSKKYWYSWNCSIITRLLFPDEGYNGLCYNYVLCYNYLSNIVGKRLDLSIEGLLKNEFRAVSSPQKEDIVLYGDESHLCAGFFKGHHIGIICAVNGTDVWVESKWGKRSAYLHLLEAVPKGYGDRVLYFRQCEGSCEESGYERF